jgi:hypothetical protein
MALSRFTPHDRLDAQGNPSRASRKADSCRHSGGGCGRHTVADCRARLAIVCSTSIASARSLVIGFVSHNRLRARHPPDAPVHPGLALFRIFRPPGTWTCPGRAELGLFRMLGSSRDPACLSGVANWVCFARLSPVAGRLRPCRPATVPVGAEGIGFARSAAARRGLYSRPPLRPVPGNWVSFAHSARQGPDRPAKLASFRTSNFTPQTSDFFSIGFVSSNSRACPMHHNSFPGKHLTLSTR